MNDRQPDAQGDLMRYPFPRLLFYLYKKQLLGELEIAQPDAGLRGRIYFRDGLPVFTDLPCSSDVLGQVLLERGLIDQAAFNASLQKLAAGKQLQGQILLGLGALDQQGLVEGLRLQLLRKLSRIFPLTAATFAIYSGEHAHGNTGEEAYVQADPLWVIYHGVRNSFDATRMQPELEKLQGKLIGLPTTFEQVRSRYGMGEEMHPLVTLLLRGSIPIEKLYRVTNIGPVLTQMLVYTFWVTEVLVAGDDPRRSAPQPSADQATAEPAAQAEPPPDQPPQNQPPPQDQPPQDQPPPAQRLANLQQDRQRHYETAPEVAALAQSFSEIPVVKPPREATAPSAADAPPPAKEGVYAVPVIDVEPPEPSPPATAPPKPVAPAPATATAVSLKAAQHQKLVRKTFERCQKATHYEVLEVGPDATEEQIREAYLTLAKAFHPDRVAALGLADVHTEAADIFRKINEAHTVLTNREQRKAYDEEQESGGLSGAARDALTAEFVFQKAVVLLRKKNYSAALRDFEEAAELNPKEGEHLAYIAWTRFSDPKQDTSTMLPQLKAQLLQAIKLSPKSYTCNYFLGEIYLALSDIRKAQSCFSRVLELNPDHIEASRHLRILRMRKDQREKKKSGGLFSRLSKKK